MTFPKTLFFLTNLLKEGAAKEQGTDKGGDKYSIYKSDTMWKMYPFSAPQGWGIISLLELL